MIRITKLPEPQHLVDHFAQWTADAVLHHQQTGRIERNDRRRYRHDDIKTTLQQEAANKCAYCESFLDHNQFGHIEHIVPCSRIPQQMFVWTNLILSCDICNIEKGDYLNIFAPLINPINDEPEEHLFYVGNTVAELTAQGKQTWTELDLNRDGLIKDRNRTLKVIDNYLKVLREYDHADTISYFQAEIQKLCTPQSEYSKMVRDYIFATEFAHLVSSNSA